MKKTYLSAVIMSLASVGALADSGNVTISGKVEGGLHIEHAVGGVTQHKIDDAGSELNFSGSEDLGNGMKAIWQVNSDLRIDGSSGAGTLASGDTFVGLAGNFGALKIGKGINAFGDGYFKGGWYVYDRGLDYDSVSSGSNKGAVKYEFPAMGGFTAALSWAAGEDKTTTARATDAWAMSANYAGSNWGVHFGYNAQKNASSGRNSNTNLAAKITPVDNFTIGAEYNLGRLAGSSVKQKSFGLYADYQTGRLHFRGLVIRTKNHSNVDGKNNRVWGLGMSYDLSKRTAFFAEYKREKINTNSEASRDLFIGLSHSF